MGYVQMTLDDWIEIKQRLKLELQGVKQSFVRIGYMLRKIDDQKAYESDGYKTVTEFAKAEYGLEASTVSRFMSINREYSVGGYSETLRPEFADLGRSQLEEMLKLPEGDRQMIQPETPREDIRELKRFNKTEPEAGVADDLRQLAENFYKDNPGILNEVFAGEERGQTVKQFAQAVNPGGNRSYRKGMFFLMMYENRITVKKFGESPRDLSWQEFYQITLDIFGDAAAGAQTWRSYFGGEEDAGDSIGKVDERTPAGSRTDNAGTDNRGTGKTGTDGGKVSLRSSGAGEPIPRRGEEGGTGGIFEEGHHLSGIGETVPAHDNTGCTGAGNSDADSGDSNGRNLGVGGEPETKTAAGEPEKPGKPQRAEDPERGIAPAQKPAETLEKTGKNQDAEEEQIPGQKTIMDYSEYLPDSMKETKEGSAEIPENETRETEPDRMPGSGDEIPKDIGNTVSYIYYELRKRDGRMPSPATLRRWITETEKLLAGLKDMERIMAGRSST